MLTETHARGAAPPGVGAPRRRGARLRRAARWPALIAICGLLAGCGTTYLMQAAGGEWHVLHAREPIDQVIADPHTPPEVRQRLEQVRAAREFASSELGLPDNQSFRTYADIGRPYVVWNVVAAPEFSVEPRRWCFPVAGCVDYRGYFSERKARDFALELEAQGFDVALGGVPAYSTLGEFADPVLSSMLRYDDTELAAIMFHELAHQLLYVRDDSEFNEAFATTVEDAGLERWLTHQGEAARIEAYRRDQAHEQAFVDLLVRTRARLETLYGSGVPRAQMRAGKAAVFTSLATEMRALEHLQGEDYPLYDEWIAAGLNNADLASVATYYDCVPGFTRLLKAQDNDLRRFYSAARALAKLPRAERHARLCAQHTGNHARVTGRLRRAPAPPVRGTAAAPPAWALG
jgi:predicted aminopeptidase